MLYKSIHTTLYDYVEPVSLCHNVFHLTARMRSGKRGGRANCESVRRPPS